MARKPTRARALGVTDADYERLLTAQGGHCALCPTKPKSRRLHVDHDHATGKVRGLLCYRCNRALPASLDADWHRDAADYLDDECRMVSAPPADPYRQSNSASLTRSGLLAFRPT